MNSCDSDDLEADPRLSESVRALPIPETPPALESRVRFRIRRRRVQRAALASTSVLVLVGALFVWQPWSATPAPVVQLPQPTTPVVQASREIPPDELAVLFAPPPVDSLTIVGGRNEKFVAALNRMEGVK